MEDSFLYIPENMYIIEAKPFYGHLKPSDDESNKKDVRIYEARKDKR